MVGAMPFRFQMFGRITIIVWRVISSQTVQKLSSQPFHKLSGLVVHELSDQLVHEHPPINPMSAGSPVHGSFALLGSLSSSLSISAVVCGAIALASSPSQPLFYFLPLFHQCDSCLKWELIAGLYGFASHRGSILSRYWLATVELSPCEYARHPPSTKQGSWLNVWKGDIQMFKTILLF